MKTIEIKNKINKTVGKISVKNITDRKSEIRFDGDIVSTEWDKWENEDKCPADVISLIQSIGSNDVDIFINSPGGSVFAGMTIYNVLKRLKGFKTVYVDGLAGSIASIIAMAGDKIVIPKNAFLMIHKPLCSCYGNADDMMKTVEILNKVQEGLLNVYMTKVKEGIEAKTINNLMDLETWFTGQQAEQYFDIEIGENNNMVASIFKNDFENKLNIPKLIEDKLKIENEVEKIRLELELMD